MYRVIEFNDMLRTAQEKAQHPDLESAIKHAHEIIPDPSRYRDFAGVKVRAPDGAIDYEIRGTATPQKRGVA